MATGQVGTPTVSRTEYYRGQMIVWFYIILLVGRLTAKSTDWPDVLLLIGSFLLFFSYIIRPMQERRAAAKS
jgi:hypothetical protein